MIDGNQLREEFGRYLAEHKATRWGMDAALMHVCKIAYDAGKADGPGAGSTQPGIRNRGTGRARPPPAEIHRLARTELAGRATARAHPARSAAPAGVPMPKPVAYGFGNTAITGHTNRLMMVRIDIPGGDQYAGAFWLPLVLADEAHTYGVACRAAGEAAGYVRGRKEVEISADSRGMFVARLENMQQQGTRLTAQEVLALLNDCDMLAARDCSALRGEVK